MTMRNYTAAELNLPLMAEVLNDRNSFIPDKIDSLGIQMNWDTDIIRAWRAGDPELASQLRAYLNIFTDPTNVPNPASPPKSAYYVDDPVTEQGLEYHGRWRQGFVRVIKNDDQDYWVVQVLRKGWATTIAFTEGNEGRLQQDKELPGNNTGIGNLASDDPEKYLLVMFPNFSTFNVMSAVAGLADTIESPIIQGQTYTGAWHKIRAQHDIQEDGSSQITVLLARPQYTLDAYRNIGGSGEADEVYLWNVPKDLAQTIIDDYEDTGKSARPSYRGELVDIVLSSVAMDSMFGSYHSYDSCLRVSGELLYENLTYALEAPSSGQGFTYRAQNSFNPEGGYNARLEYTASVECVVPFRDEYSPFRTTMGLLYKNERGVIEAPNTNNSGIYRSNMSKNEDCTYDGSLLYTFGNDTGEAEFESVNSTLSEEDTVIYRDRNTQIYALASGQGYIYTAENQLTDFGLYNARMQHRESTPDIISFYALNSPFKSSYAVSYSNSRTVITAPTTTVGLYAVNQRENDDGTYTGLLTYEKTAGGGVAAFETLNSTLSEEDRIIYKSQDTAIDATSSAQGYIYRANNQLGDDGLYDATLDYIESTADVVRFTSMKSPFRDRNNILYSNSRAVITTPAATVGMYRAEQRENDDGTYSGMLTYDSAGGGGVKAFESLNSQLFEEDRIIYKSQETAVDAISSSQGYIYRANNVLGDDGLYDATLDYRESIAISLCQSNQIFTSLRSVVDESYRNSRSLIVPASTAYQGVMYKAANQIQDDGTYNGLHQITESHPQSLYTTFNARHGIGWKSSFRNQDSIASFVALLTASRNNSLSVGINEDLTYDGEVSSTPAAGTNVFVGASADFYSYRLLRKEDKGAVDAPPKIAKMYIYTRSRFHASRQDSAKFIDGGDEVDLSFVEGLWRGTRNDFAGVTDWSI